MRLRPAFRIEQIHPDTLDYRSRILANGGTISDFHLTAIDTFVKSIYGNNLRSLLLECYPLAGNNLVSALTKLWNNSNPNIANNGFTDSNYSPTTGITGNGGAYLNSNFTPSTSSLTPFSASAGIYNRSNIFENGVTLGGSDASNNVFNFLVGWGDNLNYFDCYDATTMSGRLITPISNNCLRFNVGTRISSVDSRYFQNGNQLAAIITGGGSLPAIPLYILGYNSNGSVFFSSTKSIGFGFIGKGMTAFQVSTLTTIVNQLMTTMGRAV